MHGHFDSARTRALNEGLLTYKSFDTNRPRISTGSHLAPRGRGGPEKGPAGALHFGIRPRSVAASGAIPFNVHRPLDRTSPARADSPLSDPRSVTAARCRSAIGVIRSVRLRAQPAARARSR